MSVNYTCFFETSDGDLDAHFSDKEFSIYALLCFGFTPEANRSIPNIPITWNSIENDDCGSEIHSGRCGSFHIANCFKWKSLPGFLFYSKRFMETSSLAHED